MAKKKAVPGPLKHPEDWELKTTVEGQENIVGREIDGDYVDYILCRRNEAGDWYWNAKSLPPGRLQGRVHDKTVGTSGEPFASKSNCLRSARKMAKQLGVLIRVEVVR